MSSSTPDRNGPRATRGSGPLLCVAMCTYNGASYVRGQLDSIVRQSLLPDELLVCDDGSTDDTVQLVREFSAKAPFPVRIFTADRRHGVVLNFERALRHTAGRYIALSDQDDEWEPERLEAAMSAIRQVEAQRGSHHPALVHSDMRVIDSSGAQVDASFFQRRGFRRRHPQPLRELVLQNYVTGCSALLNRPLLDLALPFPTTISIHDWWLALIAAATGTVVTLDEPTVRYRLHSANIIGPKRVEWRQYVRRDRALGLFRRALEETKALQARLEERGINDANTDFLRKYHSTAAAGGVKAALQLLAGGVRLQNALPTAIYYAHVLAGRLAPN